MYISDEKIAERRSLGVKVYAPVTVFCAVFFLIYDRFSHGVRSPYMTFLFVPPLVLGLLPSLIIYLLPRIPKQPAVSADVYHAGVASVTVSSMLRGIFEIAGTSSSYQEYLMVAGVVLLAAGAVIYAAAIVKDLISGG